MPGHYRSCHGPSSAIVVSVIAAVAASDAHIIIDSGMSQQGCGTLWGALTECRGGDNRKTIARQDHQFGLTDKQLGPLSGEGLHVAPWSIIVGQSWHQASRA